MTCSPIGLAARMMAAGALAMLPVTAGFAQALRSTAGSSSAASSVAAGPTSDRNSTPTSSTTGLPAVNAQQSITTGTGSGSPISILGMPLRVAAPVTAPYNGQATYDTFAGQPANGRNAVLQQSIDGAP